MRQPRGQQERGPIRGAGVGLRSLHYEAILRDRPDVPWFEVLVDNYLAEGSAPLHPLERIRRDYPVTFHGVGLSLGSTYPLNRRYRRRLKELIERYEPAWCSDHLCWISAGGDYVHDLLPLPYVEEAGRHVASRIRQVQDFLGRRILIENVSSYLAYKASVLEEWDFLRFVVEEADCDVLLDVNNVYVSARNHGFDSHEYLSAIPAERVRELHLAGHDDRGTHLLDTHGARVSSPVWDLYRGTLGRLGPVPTLLEWDTDIPEFEVLQAEAASAARLLEAAAPQDREAIPPRQPPSIHSSAAHDARELQQRILDALWSGKPSAETLALLREDRPLGPAEQLAFYRGSIRSALTSALSEVYRVCRRLVGERFFGATAAAFILQERSRSPDLNDYGAAFADFLSAFTPATPLPYLPDVARLEWAWHQAFYEPDSEAMELDSLARALAIADPDRVVFRLQRNASLVESAYPVHLIWQANQPGRDGEDAVDLSKGGVDLLVWRPDVDRLMEPLKPCERCLLRALAEGLALGDLCLRLATQHPTADIGELLAAALRRGWLAGFALA